MLRDVAAPPYDLELDTAMQTIATSVLWIGSLALLAYAVKMSREERSPFPVMIWFAVAIGSLIEPLYDTAYHLFWLDNGDQWTLFTGFGLPQPVWVMPAYIMVFGLPGLLLYRKMSEGVTLEWIFKFAGLTALTTAIFEITAINLDLYVYYGEQPLMVFDYPIHIAFMEAAQITGFACLCAVLKLRATKPIHYCAVFVIFPANFAFDTLGAGFPSIMAINTPDPQMWVMVPAALISIVLAATALWWTAQLLLHLAPKPSADGDGDAPRTPGHDPAAHAEPAGTLTPA